MAIWRQPLQCAAANNGRRFEPIAPFGALGRFPSLGAFRYELYCNLRSTPPSRRSRSISASPACDCDCDCDAVAPEGRGPRPRENGGARLSLEPVRIDHGSIVGPYVVERRLAHGGANGLFLARDGAAGRDAVLKFVPDDLATPASRARILREARALAALDHPGIVRIFNFGDHAGMPWIAMEHVRGIDLKRFIAERGAVSAEQAMRWILKASDALIAAHDAGVIHRDLKPSNILLAPNDQIKVVDFGAAKRRTETLQGDAQPNPRDGHAAPDYLSPEQLEHGLADERSDVWALGCVLYELCVGSPPFGRAGSATMTAAILRDEPLFPSFLGGAVVDIINGCLRKNSFARIGSPRELSALLRVALESSASDFNPTVDRNSARQATPAPRSHAGGVRQSDPPPRSTNRPSGSMRALSVAPRGSIPAPPSQSQPQPPPPPTGSFTRQSSSSMRAASRTAPPPAVGRIKGTAVRAGLIWYGTMYGSSVMSKLYDVATPELQVLLRAGDPAFGIIASGWYDTARVGELLELMDRLAFPEDSDAYVNALSAAIARDNVGGIYRSLFKLIATPALLEANAQRIWGTYVDEGVLVARATERGKLAFEVRRWAHHHPTVCRTLGFMIQNLLRAIGYTALVVDRTECVSAGDGRCTFEGLYLA